jgi:hypothetical protein
LASFGREQARWFFGRDQLTAELIARLDERLRTGGVQVVVAPSGAGKSSLLHAGLLPQLRNGALPGSSRWPTIVFTPTAHPLTVLATQIAALTSTDPAALAEERAAGSQLAGAALRQALHGRMVVTLGLVPSAATLATPTVSIPHPWCKPRTRSASKYWNGTCSDEVTSTIVESLVSDAPLLAQNS